MERHHCTVIHPNDPSTQFLSCLYSDIDIVDFVDERASEAGVLLAITAAQQVMMLGHGTPWGLLSPTMGYIINDNYAQALSHKECIGIWCYANMFAEAHHLHGLFSGMIISEPEEAEAMGVESTKEEILTERALLAQRLQQCIHDNPLADVPRLMREMPYNPSPLNKFNYNNFHYYD